MVPRNPNDCDKTEAQDVLLGRCCVTLRDSLSESNRQHESAVGP